MKKITIIILAVLFAIQLNAQTGVSISSDNSDPDNSAMLDVQSTTKGFLPPVMTEVQRNLIASPAAGLQIYNSTTKQPNFYNGTEWMNFDGTSAATVVLAIGDVHAGGIIFYLDGNGGGLVCGETNESTSQAWAPNTTTDVLEIPNVTNATNDPNADGLAYSNAIVAAYTDGATSTAAGICRSKTTGGHADWYLPTQYELNLMYTNLHLATPTALGNFASAWYWSSSEYNGYSAWGQYFGDGAQYYTNKNGNGRVRAVRAF